MKTKYNEFINENTFYDFISKIKNFKLIKLIKYVKNIVMNNDIDDVIKVINNKFNLDININTLNAKILEVNKELILESKFYNKLLIIISIVCWILGISVIVFGLIYSKKSIGLYKKEIQELYEPQLNHMNKKLDDLESTLKLD